MLIWYDLLNAKNEESYLIQMYLAILKSVWDTQKCRWRNVSTPKRDVTTQPLLFPTMDNVWTQPRLTKQLDTPLPRENVNTMWSALVGHDFVKIQSCHYRTIFVGRGYSTSRQGETCILINTAFVASTAYVFIYATISNSQMISQIPTPLNCKLWAKPTTIQMALTCHILHKRLPFCDQRSKYIPFFSG